MALTRRQTMLTLARMEWDAIVRYLENDRETAEATAPAVSMLKWRLSQTDSEPDEFVAISQAPADWSPVILALSLNVLRHAELLPLAERLRDQMASQSRHMESRLSADELSGEMRRVPIYPDDLARRILSTN